MTVVRMPIRSVDSVPFARGDHVEISNRLIEKLHSEAPLVFADGRFYRYARTGIFEVVETARISRLVQSFAGAPVLVGDKTAKPLRLKATDVHGAIKLAADQVADVAFFEKAPRGVVFADGFVEITANKIIQHEHAPKNRARFAYPFGYLKGAQPVRLLEFFAQVFRDDEDASQKVALLQEYLGVSLLGLATKYQRVIVMLGDGANGKGVFSSIAERCMPPGSVCSIPPQDLGQEYRRALLAGKLLNIVSELPEADILDSESWKAMVAGDTTTGREIRKEPFSFKPVAGHVYSANRLPGTTDQSHGFWRRLLVVQFNRVFAEREQDPDLADRIVQSDHRAVVAWALIGASRVLKIGHYTVPRSSAKALDKWRAHADQVRAFVDDWTSRLLPDEPLHMGTQAEVLYKAYRTWAQENGHRPVASNTFGERMCLLGLGSKSDGFVRRHPVRLERTVEHGD